MRKFLFVLLFLCSCNIRCAGGIWVKGNTHTHTSLSDGDSTPGVVCEWYQCHGYDFLVLTDHSLATPQDVISTYSNDKFLVIGGEEISSIVNNTQVHVNAIGTKETIQKSQSTNITTALLENVDSTKKTGCVAQINHPSFYAIDSESVKKLNGPLLMEVYNHNASLGAFGGLAQIVFEQTWDTALSAGVIVYCTATDDSHYFKPNSTRCTPGGGFIMVKVNKLDRDEILNSLLKGDFYASTGVLIDEITNSDTAMKIKIKPKKDTSYKIVFIGLNGLILSESKSINAVYKPKKTSSEKYIRVKIIASDGTCAWTQPLLQKQTKP